MMDKTTNRMENGRPGGAARRGGLARAGLLRALALVLLALPGGAVWGGDLNPPAGGPSDSASAMYTLLDIWNRLTTNATATKRAGVFAEPSAGPGATGKTLDEIYAAALPTQVPKTGKTTSSAAGDDGDLEKGVAWPSPRFTDNGDGTVTDNLTGLIWLKNANCGGTMTWANALTYCHTLSSGSCGLSDGSVEGDWRLPNRRELLSLIDDGRSDPALPSGHPFTGVLSSYYWSSTAFAFGTSLAWSVYLFVGSVNGIEKSDTNYVWPVRGGQ